MNIKIKKKEVKKQESINKINCKKIIIIAPKILQLIEETRKDLLIDNRAKVYLKLFKLLDTSIKVLLKQNMNFYSNKLFLKDVLEKEIINVRNIYKTKTDQTKKDIGGVKSYNSLVQKINQNIAKIEELKSKKNPTKEEKAMLKKYIAFLENNKRIRFREISTFDVYKTISLIKEKSNVDENLQDVYKKAIVPILNFFMKEKVISFVGAKEINDTIIRIINNGIIVEKSEGKENNIKKDLINSSIRIEYGPIQEVFNKGDMFGYRGNIGLTFVESIGKKSQKIETGREYLKRFIENSKGGEQKNNQLLYFILKNFIEKDHKLVFKGLATMINKAGKKLSEKGVDEKILNKVFKIGNSIFELETVEKEVDGKKEKVIIIKPKR